MRATLSLRTALFLLLVLLCGSPGFVMAQADAQQATAPKKVKLVGVVKAISGSGITLQTDAGPEISVSISPATKLLRLEPGQSDLKSAPAVQLSDVQVGDRMAIAGVPSDDGKSLSATTAVVMKKADVAEKQQREREDWQRNGVAGIVKAIDARAGTITVATGTLAANTVTVHLTNTTVIRRYAPNSIKFDDAKAGTLEQIKGGDQLRARGSKSEDGRELTAAEIVSGTFRSIPATFISADAANNNITVSDLVSKRPVTLKIGPDSQLHQLPDMFAQRIAMRLKGGAAAGTSGESSMRPAGDEASSRVQGNNGGSGTGARAAGGPPDFQQMLNRMPAVAPGELQKGSALMIVATEGTADSPSEVIILLSGVEPILTAVSPQQASTVLSPWNLSAGGNAGTGDAP